MNIHSWDNTMALHRLRKEGYSLRECSRRMSLPLAQVEEIYLFNVHKGGQRRELMRINGEIYLRKRNKSKIFSF